jgi:hypothetical protein
MLLCGPQNIWIFRTGIKLGVTPSDIPKVDFAPALNQILTHTRMSNIKAHRISIIG